MLTETHDAVDKYLQQIHIVFRRYNLIDVMGEGNYLNKFDDQIGHLRPKYNKNGEVDFQEEDLLYIVRETRFAVANTILLFEIGLAEFHISQSDYGPVGRFSGTEIDSRFFYFVDDVFMRLYNFWNRVANFLNIFFELEKDEDKVYFSPIMDKLAINVGADRNFQSLQKFRESEYKDIINKRRRKIVHRKSSSFTYFESFLKNIQKPEVLSKLQEDRDELPQFFITSYKRTIQGMDEMLALIKDNVKLGVE